MANANFAAGAGGPLSMEPRGRRNKLMSSITKGLWRRQLLSTDLPLEDGEDQDGNPTKSSIIQGRPAWRARGWEGPRATPPQSSGCQGSGTHLPTQGGQRAPGDPCRAQRPSRPAWSHRGWRGCGHGVGDVTSHRGARRGGRLPKTSGSAPAAAHLLAHVTPFASTRPEEPQLAAGSRSVSQRLPRPSRAPGTRDWIS